MYGIKSYPMSKRTVSGAVISFNDGSFVKWIYVGKTQQTWGDRHTWKIHVRVEQPPTIEQFFETWDKPSMHTASHFIRNAIKDFKELK